METLEQPKIAGYRQLPAADAAIINEAKAIAEQCGALIERHRAALHVLMATPDELVALADMIEELHSAICQAVALLNRSPECARGVESREAHNILREALIDYANRCSQPQGGRQ